MIYLLVWRAAHPGYPNSGANFRPIVAYSTTDTFTVIEHIMFQVVSRPDLAVSDMRCYLGLSASDLAGPLVKMAEQDTPAKSHTAEGVPVRWTDAEMDARE